MAAPMAATTDVEVVSPAQQRITKMIKAYMAEADEKQADLARLLNVEQPQVSRMLSGRRKLTVDELEIIAVHYDRHPGAFFEGLRGEAHQNRKKMTGSHLAAVPDVPGQQVIPFPLTEAERTARRGHLRALS